MIAEIATIYDKIPEIYRRVILRILLSTIVLGIVCNLATYWYAVRYGAQIPLEGVPFLIVLSITSSLIITGISILTYLLGPVLNAIPPVDPADLTNLILKRGKQFGTQAPKEYQEWYESREWNHTFRDRLEIQFKLLRYLRLRDFYMVIPFTFWVYADLAKIYAFRLLVIGATGLAAYLCFLDYLNTSSLQSLLLSMIAIYVLILVLLKLTNIIGTKSADKIGITTYTLSVIIISALLLGPWFNQILRSAKYGGGIPVIIHTMGHSSPQQSDGIVEGYLFLVSSRSTTLYHPVENAFRQINNKHIIYTEYPATPTISNGTQKIVMPSGSGYCKIRIIQKFRSCETENSFEVRPG